MGTDLALAGTLAERFFFKALACHADKRKWEANAASRVGSHQLNTVLVVDDEPSVLDYLAGVLQYDGYQCRCFSEGLAALSYLSQRNRPADLLLADISMPGMDGIDLLRNVKGTNPEMPVILISGLYELAIAVDALDAGADDYLRKPVKPQDVLALVNRYLDPNDGSQEREVQKALREFLDAEGRASASSPALESLFSRLGFKRYETFQHSARVASTCRLFGQYYGLDPDELDHLEIGALLHDIGKIGIPRNILLKPGSLSAEEWRVMREHPTIGHRILSEFPELRSEAEIVYSHHERWDGCGYTHGLKGEAIPIGARMFSIVDTFDAITSHRPYRKAGSAKDARLEILRMSGTQFDPELVDVFLRMTDRDLLRIRETYPDALEQTA